MRATSLFYAIAISGLCACSSQEEVFLIPPPPEPAFIIPGAVTAESGALLDPGELLIVQSKADAGDRDAAFRLARHFDAAGNKQESNRWQRIAAERGHPVAQYNMWFDNRNSSDCPSMCEALAWLEIAARSGFQRASAELDAYSAKVKDKCN